MTHYDWSRITPEQLNPQITRKAIHTANMTVARFELQKGGVVAEHSHHQEQISTVERGALRFTIDGGEQIVRAGESLSIPSNMPHGVVALEDSVVLDIFSPPRDDWRQQ